MTVRRACSALDAVSVSVCFGGWIIGLFGTENIVDAREGWRNISIFIN